MLDSAPPLIANIPLRLIFDIFIPILLRFRGHSENYLLYLIYFRGERTRINGNANLSWRLKLLGRFGVENFKVGALEELIRLKLECCGQFIGDLFSQCEVFFRIHHDFELHSVKVVSVVFHNIEVDASLVVFGHEEIASLVENA